MKRLNALIDELADFIPDHEILNPAVSASSIGWHIEHSLLTLNLVVQKISESEPENYQPKFNFWKTIILVFKKLPRGKVKAPKMVRPNNEHTAESLKNHIAVTKENIKVFSNLKKNHFFIHPFLGAMNLKQTICFLGIHTRHHLGIMNEIRKSSQ